MKNSWPLVTLREVLRLSIDAVPVDPSGSYPIAGVYSFGRGLLSRACLPGSETTYNVMHRLHKDDFVLSQLKAWEGALAKVPSSYDGWFLSPQFPTFRSILDRLEINYLDWYCKQSKVWDELKNTARGMGARRDSVSPDRFLALKIPLPPVREQRRIVARIEELASKINEAYILRHQVTEVEVPALRNTIVHNVFGNERPYVHLEDVCSLITDGTHQTPRYVDDGFMFLSAQNVKPFRFMPEVHRKVSAEDYGACIARARPRKGDVLMTRVGAMIGEAALIDRDLDFAFYVSLAILRPIKERIMPEFLVHWLNSPDGLLQSRKQTLGKGHSQGNLNLKLLRGFDVPLPSLAEQHRIVTMLDTVQSRVDMLKKLQAETAAELDALLPSILDRAFKGEL